LCLIDSDGCFTGNWKYQGALADQPYTDITIYKVIRSKWVELRNDDIKASGEKAGAGRTGGLVNPGITRSAPSPSGSLHYMKKRRR
jgi:hypothetical protein